MIFKRIAKVIRILSIPPIVATITFITLYLTNYITLLDSFMLIIFLSLIQLIAYPISYLIPNFKKQGREGQRSLAFYFGIIGYSLGLLYALITGVTGKLLVLYLTYFISIIILTFINKVLKIRASGHMTSITGPIVALSYFIGPIMIIPLLLFYILVFFSSLYLKRHTIKEIFLGTMTVLISFSLSLLLIMT